MSLPLPLPRALCLAGMAVLLAGCADAPAPGSGRTESSEDQSIARAHAILDSARTAAGADVLTSGALVTFDFRDAHFRLRRQDGAFSYTRVYHDSLGRRTEDVLTNDTLRRRRAGRPVSLTRTERRQAETAVNSVAYFALLPFPLGDPAVQPRYMGSDTVRGVPYHRVEVTFRREGGGRDWQDRFVYWFDQRDYSMDYLAYAYGQATPGEEPGTRFRAAFNERRVGGLRLADYRNYTALDSLSAGALARYPRLLASDSLRLVSTVALDSVRVRPLGS